jgi:hypothetical protein
VSGSLKPTVGHGLVLDPGLNVSVRVNEAKMRSIGKWIPVSLTGEAQKVVNKKLPNHAGHLHRLVSVDVPYRSPAAFGKRAMYESEYSP